MWTAGRSPCCRWWCCSLLPGYSEGVEPCPEPRPPPQTPRPARAPRCGTREAKLSDYFTDGVITWPEERTCAGRWWGACSPGGSRRIGGGCRYGSQSQTGIWSYWLGRNKKYLTHVTRVWPPTRTLITAAPVLSSGAASGTTSCFVLLHTVAVRCSLNNSCDFYNKKNFKPSHHLLLGELLYLYCFRTPYCPTNCRNNQSIFNTVLHRANGKFS